MEKKATYQGSVKYQFFLLVLILFNPGTFYLHSAQTVRSSCKRRWQFYGSVKRNWETTFAQ
jgi:hypothetical protein